MASAAAEPTRPAPINPILPISPPPLIRPPQNAVTVEPSLGYSVFDNGTNAREQIVLPERLNKKANHTRVQCARAHSVVGIGGDQNRGNGLTSGDELLIK